MADALDLRHRFPRLWAKVEAVRSRRRRPAASPPTPAPCRSRRPAGSTRSSPPGSTGSGCRPSSGWSRWPPLGSRPRSRPQRSGRRSGRHVTLSHPRPGEYAGTSYLEAAGDTQDLTAFYALVCEEAKQLGRLGDTDDFETRKAKALGVIAPAGSLEFTEETPTAGGEPSTGETNLYVHVSLADLATHRRPGRR